MMIAKLNSFISLESLKSIKLPNALRSLKSQSPAFDKTKAAKLASSVVLFSFSGWFIWHTFLATPVPTLSPSMPHTVATINPTPATPAPIPATESTESQEQLTVTESDEMSNELLAATDTQEALTDNIQNQIQQDTQLLSNEIHDSIEQQLATLCETTNSCSDHYALDATTEIKTLKADDTPKKNNQLTLTARSNLDARECLDLIGNMAIHRCAENFR